VFHLGFAEFAIDAPNAFCVGSRRARPSPERRSTRHPHHVGAGRGVVGRGGGPVAGTGVAGLRRARRNWLSNRVSTVNPSNGPPV
jgi:hypothetical protein